MEFNEESDLVASEHDKLISAISKLDRTQHITEPTRFEPTNNSSEFTLIKRSNKLDLENVVKVLEDTATHVKIGKKLKKTQDKSKILPKPLEKPQAERIKRAAGYQETKKKVGRWDPVVSRSRTADFVVYPIKPSVGTKMSLSNEFLSQFELKSELEKELEEVDPQPIVEEEEEEKVYPMSYEEMVEHRQHLAKLRAQQSYKDAKAKRQSKIKSKKFHRVLKKEKLKQQLKEFEELQKSNPEEALKKLEAIEKARALERHTLRHKNTGKWAKNQMIRAKYDKDVRQQIADQLAVSRSLTQKSKEIDSSDDEDADADEVIPDINLSQDPMNPWMLKKSDGSNVTAEFDFGYKKYLKEKMNQTAAEYESDTDKEKNEDITDTSNNIKQLRQQINNMNQNFTSNETNVIEDQSYNKAMDKIDLSENKNNDEITTNSQVSTKDNAYLKKKKGLESKVTKRKNKMKPSSKTKVSATTEWVVDIVDDIKIDQGKSIDITSAFESLENKVVGKVEEKLNTLRKQIEKLEKTSKGINKNRHGKQIEQETDNLEYLKLNNQKQNAIIDEELIETGFKDSEETPKDDIQSQAKLIANAVTASNSIDSNNIDPNTFIEVKPKYLNTALVGNEANMDLLDDDDHVVPKVNIEEVFEEDDVVASFRQEKEDEINKDKPESIELSLPGWGSWGGKGVKAPKRKKNRFILKPAPVMPRRDENKGAIIIKEYKDPKLTSHKVREIPYPFKSLKDYEASIRIPLGNTFIPEKAHKKLIQPNVITKAGAIIEPMDEDELLVKKNLQFNNKEILKMVGLK